MVLTKCNSDDQTRWTRWREHVTRMADKWIQSFVGKPNGKRPLRNYSRRWERNTNAPRNEKEGHGMDSAGTD
jgi:hypothetical protein